jgi:menaquinone-specific isochorismate synthase
MPVASTTPRRVNPDPAVPAAPPSPASDSGLGRLHEAVRDAVARWDGTAALRVEVSVEAADALGWLGAQTFGPRVAWSERDGSESRAVVGAALTIDAETLDAAAGVDAALALLPPRARLYGTVRFDPAADAAAEWAPFGRVRFVLPRAELVVDGRGAVLAAHVAPGERLGHVLADLARLRPAPAYAQSALPRVERRGDRPGPAGWAASVRWALGAFADGALGKVVLARRADLAFDGRVDPFALLRRLAAATPRCFHVLVAPDDASASAGTDAGTFVAATPERLFRLAGRDLQTEAVAGTRPRAADDAADDRLLGELMASEKDAREHAFVRDAIAERLAPLATDVRVDAAAGAMTLARGRHIRTGIEATLAPATTALDVLRALHPTPAVGGTPREAARDAIGRLEPFDRGLYAGAVGWIGKDADGAEAAEFAVGIRSALVRGRTVSLYSGAGIVAGSDPAAEWAEIEHKIGDFVRVLGTAPRPSRSSPVAA